MGLSKLFPGRKRRRERKEREKEKVQQKGSEEGKKEPASNAPATIPPIADLSNNGDNDAEAPKQVPSGVQESASQRVWNRAYDNLASDDATKELVKAYTKAIKKASKPDDEAAASDTDEDIAGMHDPAQRDKIMRDALKSGKAKVYTSTKATNAVGSVSNFILKFKETIDFAIGDIPQAALPWAGVCIGLTFLLNPAQASQANLNGLGHVTSRMEWYCSLTTHLLSKEHIDTGSESFEAVRDQLEGRVVDLYQALLLYQMKSVCSYYKNQGWVFLRNLINLDDWDGELEGVKEAETAVNNDSKQYNNVKAQSFLGDLVRSGQKTQESLGDFHQTLQSYIADQRARLLDEQLDRCLRDLYVLDPKGQMDTIQGKNDQLLPEAYKWILRKEEYQALTDWSDKSSCQVLWLNGPAGTGKTMLMIGIITEILGQSSKLAPGISYFFCQTEEKTKNGATAALRSLIWLLLIQQPHLFSYLKDKHRSSGAAMFKSNTAFYPLVEIFKAMLADKHLSPVYLVLDALDECADGKPGVQELLSLVSDSLTITGESSGKVKWLLSSRPEVDVHRRISYKKTGAVVELNVHANKEPVNAYIAHKLSEMEYNHGYSKDILDQMEVEIRERAQNTFLWVALVFRDLIDNRVKQWKALKVIKKIPGDLSSMYDSMMAKIGQEDDEDQEFCRAVLEAACFAFRPMSFAELHALSGIPSYVLPKDIVQSCGSFLTIRDETVHVLHNTAKEYLTDYFKSRHEGGIAQSHLDMVNHSIASMSKGLKSNMYDLDPGTKLTDITVPENDDQLASLGYCCEFWVDHLCEDADQLSDDGPAFSFLKVHFLHWLESLSLLQNLPSAVLSIRNLSTKAKSTPNGSPQLVNFLEDAERFILRNLEIMTQYPLQIYASALVFSPSKNEIKARFWEQRSPSIGSVTGVRDHWDPCLQTLDADLTLRAVVFSPDGKLFASATKFDGHGNAKLWDAAIGVCIQSFEIDAKDDVSIAFSPDGEVFALAALDTLQLFDVATGTGIRTLNLPDCSIMSIAFSPDGKHFAFGLDGSVQLWDVSTWTYKQTLEGHTKSVTSVAFSSNSKTLASASDDKTLRLWDPLDGACKHVLELPSSSKTVFFSPDSNTVAAIVANMSVWDVESGARKPDVEMKGRSLMSVKYGAFSPDGSRIALGSHDGKVQLLDSATGVCTRSFHHGEFVTCLAFSKDGDIIVSASSEGLVRTWDVTSRPEESSAGHDEDVILLSFSKDGKMLATGSKDTTVKLWNPVNKQLKQTLKDHTSDIRNLVFSPDGKSLASGSYDGKILIWNTATGVCKQKLEPFNDEFFPTPDVINYSPDGARLAIGTEMGRVQVWDIGTGECEQDFQCHVDLLCWFSFQRDGKTLATGTMYEGTQIWDLDTGTCKQRLEEPMTYAAFSPDGKILASGAFEKSVQLWDVATGVSQQTVDLESVGRDISFSDDGKYLKTSQGTFEFASGKVVNTSESELSMYAVQYNDLWVTRGGEKLLWLPPDYKPDNVAFRENTLVLGGISGQVVFLEFVDR